MSDLKLYEIQASRTYKFIKFQARLESSRPPWDPTNPFVNRLVANIFEIPHFQQCGQPRNCNAIHESDNLLHMIIPNNLLILRLAYADYDFSSKDIPQHEIFHHCFPPVNAHQWNTGPVSTTYNPVPHMLTLEILWVLRYSFPHLKWYCLFHKNTLNFFIVKETENISIFVVNAMNDTSVWLNGN